MAAADGEFRLKDTLVTIGRGRPSGYAVFQSDHERISCGELVAHSASSRGVLVAALEARTRSGLITLRDGVVDDLGSELRRRGYVTASAGWFGLMGTELGRERSRAELVREFGTHDPRFRCLAGDRF
jgi:hypothetical protein